MPDAGDTTVTAPPPTPGPDTTPATSDATIATADTTPSPVATTAPTPTPTAPAAAPAPATKQPPNWGENVYRHILGALGGTQNFTYTRDPGTGKMTATPSPKSPGQQWKTIIAGALAGIGNMGNVGTGPGRMGRALSAGIQGGTQRAQQQQAQQKQEATEDYELQQKNLMDTAQRTMLTTQNTALLFRLGREGVEAKYADAQHAQDFQKYMLDTGGEYQGRAGSFEELLKMHGNDPALMKAHTQGLIAANPVIENGKYVGMDFVKTSPQWLKQRTSQDMPIDFLVKDKDNPGKWKLSTETIDAGTMSNEEYFKLKNTQDGEIMKHEDTEAKQALAVREQDTKDKEAAAAINKDYAQAGEARAQAGEATARTQQIRNQVANQSNDLETLAQAMYSGQLTKSDVQARAAANGIGLNQIMARAIQIGKDNGKPFSEEIIKQEADFANDKKVTAVLDGIERVVGTPAQGNNPPIPGQLDLMLKAARLAGLGNNAPVSQIVQVIRQKFGEETAKNFQTSLGESQRVIGGLIGNPLLGGGETDARLAQGAKTFGSDPTLKNLESTSQMMKDLLIQQRQSYTNHNRYLRQRYEGESVTGAAGTQTQPAAPPPPPPGQVNVRIPGVNGAPDQIGHVAQGNLTQFLQDHKGATTVQ
jgi:hypothetical protein